VSDLVTKKKNGGVPAPTSRESGNEKNGKTGAHMPFKASAREQSEEPAFSLPGVFGRLGEQCVVKENKSQWTLLMSRD